MSSKLSVFLLMTLLNAIVNSCFAGGPFAQGKGHGFAQAGFSSLNYEKIFDDKGRELESSGRFKDITLQLYFEVGLTPALTLKLLAPYKFVKGESSGKEQNLAGFGNFSAGLSYLLSGKKIKISSRLEVASPGMNDDNRPSLYNLRTGHSEWEVSPFISIGTSYGKLYWYADAGAGITDESVLKFAAEAGYKIINSLTVAAVIDARIPFQRNQPVTNFPPDSISNSFLYDPLREYTGTGIKLIYIYREKWGLSSSVFGALTAKRIAAAPVYNLGVFYKW